MKILIDLKAIGVIHSPYKEKEEVSKKGSASSRGFDSISGEIEIFKEYAEGLKDIEGFSHLIVLFIFHKSKGYSLHVKPFLDDKLRGLFSTRHPNRPNPIGITIVELIEKKGNILKVRGIDMIDGTPVIDIKPYTPRDQKSDIKIGWLKDKIKENKQNVTL